MICKVILCVIILKKYHLRLCSKVIFGLERQIVENYFFWIFLGFFYASKFFFGLVHQPGQGWI